MRVDSQARESTSGDSEGKRQDIDFGKFILRILRTSGGAELRYIENGETTRIGPSGSFTQSNDYLFTVLLVKKGNIVSAYTAIINLITYDYRVSYKSFSVEESNEIINDIVINTCVNKLVVTQRPIDPTYIIPGSDLSNFRSDAFIYLSADAPNFNVLNGSRTSGIFADKPTVAKNNIPIGYKYFCTDRQTTEGATDGIEIIHKGNDVWVDALGRVVS